MNLPTAEPPSEDVSHNIYNERDYSQKVGRGRRTRRPKKREARRVWQPRPTKNRTYNTRDVTSAFFAVPPRGKFGGESSLPFRLWFDFRRKIKGLGVE